MYISRDSALAGEGVSVGLVVSRLVDFYRTNAINVELSTLARLVHMANTTLQPQLTTRRHNVENWFRLLDPIVGEF